MPSPVRVGASEGSASGRAIPIRTLQGRMVMPAVMVREADHRARPITEVYEESESARLASASGAALV